MAENALARATKQVEKMKVLRNRLNNLGLSGAMATEPKESK